MNKTATLMLMSAGLATVPLSVGDTPAAAGNPPAAAPAAANDTVLQISKEFAPAALLPEDVDFAIALPNRSIKLVSDGLPIGGAVLGFAKGSAESYTSARTCQLLLAQIGMVTGYADEWKQNAVDSLGDIIIQAATRFGQENNNKVASKARGFTLHPVYLVASPQAGSGEMLRQTLVAYTSLLIASAQGQKGVENVSVDDLSGLKIPGAVMAEQIDAGNAALQNIKEELSKRTFYLLAGMKDGNAVIVLCENPEEIKWAPNPKQSLLTGITAESWKWDTPGGEAKPWAVFLTLSPQMTQAASRDGNAATIGLIKQTGDLFQAFAEKESAQAAVFRAAAAGLGSIADEIFTKPQAIPVTKPTTVAAWGTTGYAHITFKSDALGCTYKTGKLRLGDIAASPGNIFYFETPGANPACKPDIGKLISAAADVSTGVHASLDPGKQGQLNRLVQKYSDILPELKKAGLGFCTMLGGLGSSYAIVVNSTGQVTGPDKKTLQPAFSLFADVTDRAKFGQGAAVAGTAVCNVLKQFGDNKDMLRQLSIASQITGSASIYNLASPLLPSGICPNVTLNDSHVAFGTSAELNDHVIRSATGNTGFAGWVFSVNFAELAKVVDSPGSVPCCDTACTSEETGTAAPAAATATVGDEDEEDGFDANEDICEDDDSDICEVNTVRDNPIITIAGYVDSMKGTSTIENGVNTLNIDIKLKE